LAHQHVPAQLAGDVSRQIDLIGAPQLMGIEEAPAAHSGGDARLANSLERSGTSCLPNGPRCSPVCTARCGPAGSSPYKRSAITGMLARESPGFASFCIFRDACQRVT
jgi:hypothetical protein